MDVKQFAEKFRLKVRLDECGDPVIPGRRGQSQLYVERGRVCLIVLDGPLAKSSRWEGLEAKHLWLGSISRDEQTRRGVQDVKAMDIPEKNWRLAIQLARVKPKRVMSEKQAAVLSAARSLLPKKPSRELE